MSGPLGPLGPLGLPGLLGLYVLSGHMGLLGLLNVEGLLESLQHWGGPGGPCVLTGHRGPGDLGGPEAQEAQEAQTSPTNGRPLVPWSIFSCCLERWEGQQMSLSLGGQMARTWLMMSQCTAVINPLQDSEVNQPAASRSCTFRRPEAEAW